MLAFVLHIFLANYPASLINLRKDYGVDSFQIYQGESAHPWRYSCKNHLVGGGADIGRRRSGYDQQGLGADPWTLRFPAWAIKVTVQFGGGEIRPQY